jgi:hypothetical protein
MSETLEKHSASVHGLPVMSVDFVSIVIDRYWYPNKPPMSKAVKETTV